MLGKVIRNARGFEEVAFTDYYGEWGSLKQSSLAEREPPGTSAVWLGAAEGIRLHLNRAQVKGLIERLQSWLETGSFKGRRKERT